ncbi:hypothetical protein P8C59_008716 [Phyllachora maydis]|uniref:Uncharacterized protein n=1 Tax=Phyllachora maydis TaxID=1825666 RepID=A0AAD9IC00_9PEZI|nr:hypothetical protein P8C59_008716 [Phyllachora maydis]
MVGLCGDYRIDEVRANRRFLSLARSVFRRSAISKGICQLSSKCQITQENPTDGMFANVKTTPYSSSGLRV